MRDLIKKLLSEHTKKSVVINEMATKDWCSGVRSLHPTYEFCKAAENYIKNELEDSPSEKGKRRGKKIFKDFEKGLEKFFLRNINDEQLSQKLIRVEKSSPIFIKGQEEMNFAGNLLKNNCSNYQEIVNKKLDEFENKIKLYFLDDLGYSVENRLPTNYSALANLFTKFFENKGAFDGVVSADHNWDVIAKNWITHSFHPKNEFMDIRPEEERTHKLTSLDFQDLAEIYFKGSITFNSNEIKKTVRNVLEGVRGQGFLSEDEFEKIYLKGKKDYFRYAKDYGFVDMFAGIDFIYKGKDGMWIPIQVKTTATEPTYLISKLGCKKYIIADKMGKKFKMDTYPKSENLPD